jgi:hypothetical protein
MWQPSQLIKKFSFYYATKTKNVQGIGSNVLQKKKEEKEQSSIVI